MFHRWWGKIACYGPRTWARQTDCRNCGMRESGVPQNADSLVRNSRFLSLTRPATFRRAGIYIPLSVRARARGRVHSLVNDETRFPKFRAPAINSSTNGASARWQNFVTDEREIRDEFAKTLWDARSLTTYLMRLSDPEFYRCFLHINSARLMLTRDGNT